jgi:hypothetical protein
MDHHSHAPNVGRFPLYDEIKFRKNGGKKIITNLLTAGSLVIIEKNVGVNNQLNDVVSETNDADNY